MGIVPGSMSFVNVIIVTFLISGSLCLMDNFMENESRHDHDSLLNISSTIEARSSPGRNTGNNHKPSFIDCASYSTSIKEEQNRGLFVTKVQAADEDEPESGGIVTYSIIKRDGVRGYFKIDNITGEITTDFAFDRDEPSRQKEIYISVKATDNGWPVLADICTIKITILDINDNSPNFDKLKNEESVSEDLKINREVMRVFAYDIDDGDNARLTYSLRNNGAKDFETYFRIDNATGVILLQETLAQKQGTVFTSQVAVNDNPIDVLTRKENVADIKITVVGSDKQLPSFTEYPTEVIVIKENFFEFETNLTVIAAQSNIKLEDLQFELLRGHTTQTNKDSTFKLTQVSNTQAVITLGRQLDYETVTEYQLTVRVINKDSLAAVKQFDVKVEDVNDEIPSFIELVTGSVLENEPPPAEVMQVRAVDKDGTSANNIVSYELNSHTDLFTIDKDTGKVTTKVEFDRERVDKYHLSIIAKDNSPSALISRNEPNAVTQIFLVSIEDKNDNKPEFVNSTYRVHNVPENADIGTNVIEVTALDRDAASVITYRIISGNEGDAFLVERSTGRIMVHAKLDYEKIESYNLTVEASDGVYTDQALVFIFIDNINDELPVFEPYDKNITNIIEESIPPDCIITLTAYDPDIKNRSAPQNIEYKVDEKYRHFLSVDENGCVKLIKALDRDKPNGSPGYQAYIYAYDDGNSQNSQSQSAEIFIILGDINDNAPFLIIREVVWYEHRTPDVIVQLTADDYDSIENGPPFAYGFAHDIPADFTSKFQIAGDQLIALVEFDREEKKYYDIPIAITDSGIPPQTGISNLRVIIGDINDHAAQNGSSEIFVYNYKGQYPDIQIGRVFVDDPDDWDLPDKFFQWKFERHEFFQLNENDGNLTMIHGTPEGTYTLKFVVTEESPPLVPRHEVSAVVEITVRNIPEEAVRKSGSIRLSGTTIEEFVARVDGTSKKDVLYNHLSKILNATLENIDIFTVLVSPNNASLIDVRFSAHGSPYYPPERLNSKMSLNQEEIENLLNVEFVMISISECIMEDVCPAGSSCSNSLNIKDDPAIVFTNRTSFVGVQAVVEAECECVSRQAGQCLNGGTFNQATGVCACPDEFEGPNCASLAVGFRGDGWAMYPSFEACIDTVITLEVAPHEENGLVFYVGPLSIRPTPLVKDFMSLELRDGFPILLLNYGSGTAKIPLLSKKLTDGASHTIRIEMSPTEIQFSVDDCHRSHCQSLSHPKGPNTLLNVNGPLQVGGTRDDLKELASLLEWGDLPTDKGFTGCIRNLTYNGEIYNLGVPGESKNAISNCNYSIAKAATFGIDSNFLVAILVCIAILLILLLAVVVHRRKENNWNEKDTDDIRETIISYEDEGGGEVDTGYDMSVFPRMHEEEPPIKETLYKEGADIPDISGFLDTKKDTCDRDLNGYPFDDVRYYAYEGDGNSTGSLSSLASCTDDGDLKFNYLSSFGPRFRKLADMYGEDPSDEDSHDGGEESWC